MATIMVNGQIFSGKSVQVRNSKVVIDGKEYVGTDDEKKIEIHVAGDVDEIDVDVCYKIAITGNVGSIQTSSGDVEVSGNVNGDIKTSSGDVEISEGVTGSIQTSSGDVKTGSVGGKVKTNSGDIKYRK
jgi:hypothetical protein